MQSSCQSAQRSSSMHTRPHRSSSPLREELAATLRELVANTDG